MIEPLQKGLVTDEDLMKRDENEKELKRVQKQVEKLSEKIGALQPKATQKPSPKQPKGNPKSTTPGSKR